MNTNHPAQDRYSKCTLEQKIKLVFALLLLFLPAACMGQGTMTIGFQGPPPGVQTMRGANPYTDAATGMQFGGLTPQSLLLNGGGIPGYPDNGTCYLEIPAGSMRFGPNTFPPTGTAVPFNLLSIDAADLLAGPQTLTVVGYKIQIMAPILMVTNSFTVSSQTFETFNLDSSFAGVIQVDVLNASWALDDIVVSGIPEPSTGALIFLGVLCAAGHARARRR